MYLLPKTGGYVVVYEPHVYLLLLNNIVTSPVYTFYFKHSKYLFIIHLGLISPLIMSFIYSVDFLMVSNLNEVRAYLGILMNEGKLDMERLMTRLFLIPLKIYS